MDTVGGETQGFGLSAKKPVRPTHVQINKVENGYTVGGSYGVPLMIANTLDEALALAKKELI